MGKWLVGRKATHLTLQAHTDTIAIAQPHLFVHRPKAVIDRLEWSSSGLNDDSGWKPSGKWTRPEDKRND